mmetsp:Transcript_301/g.566  ORF Transcript_301/g.566 Transcript_301/m.566 type:complete len:343 (+) Transcript_301:3247-4275(+)
MLMLQHTVGRHCRIFAVNERWSRGGHGRAPRRRRRSAGYDQCTPRAGHSGGEGTAAQLPDREELKDTLLDDIEAVVILVENLGGIREIEHRVVARLVPRQTAQQVEVCTAHSVLRMVALHVVQSLEFSPGNFFGCFGHACGCHFFSDRLQFVFVAVLVFLIRLLRPHASRSFFAPHFSQLLLEVADLLSQDRFLHLGLAPRLHAARDLLRDLLLLRQLREHPQDRFQPRFHVELGQNRLLFPHREPVVAVGRDHVREHRRRVLGLVARVVVLLPGQLVRGGHAPPEGVLEGSREGRAAAPGATTCSAAVFSAGGQGPAKRSLLMLFPAAAILRFRRRHAVDQ